LAGPTDAVDRDAKRMFKCTNWRRPRLKMSCIATGKRKKEKKNNLNVTPGIITNKIITKLT
jgi:hypothetical protein